MAQPAIAATVRAVRTKKFIPRRAAIVLVKKRQNKYGSQTNDVIKEWRYYLFGLQESQCIGQTVFSTFSYLQTQAAVDKVKSIMTENSDAVSLILIPVSRSYIYTCSLPL